MLPNTPTLISPPNGWNTTDTTPTLSAQYIASEASDTGYVNYRLATSAGNCLSGTSLTESYTTPLTSTNNEATTWTTSAIAPDGTYYWCAQNYDGEDSSDWTSMGNFVLDSSTPDIVAVDAGASSEDRVSFTSDTMFS